MSNIMQTEFEFELPMGYVDQDGTLHREGIMRLATAGDEILPMKDPRVQSNPAYIAIIMLVRVVSRLGSMKGLNTHVIENLYSRDFEFLQDLYNRINKTGSAATPTTCPKCEHTFEVSSDTVGEN